MLRRLAKLGGAREFGLGDRPLCPRGSGADGLIGLFGPWDTEVSPRGRLLLLGWMVDAALWWMERTRYACG